MLKAVHIKRDYEGSSTTQGRRQEQHDFSSNVVRFTGGVLAIFFSAGFIFSAISQIIKYFYP